MSFVSSTEIGRAVRCQIVPPSQEDDFYTLIFETTLGDWACVADRQFLQGLSAKLQKYVADDQQNQSSK